MFNGVEFGQEVDLVQRYLPSHGVLNVLNSTIRELPPLNRQLAKLPLKDPQQFFYHCLVSSNLEIVDMDRHDAHEYSSTVVLEAQFVVDTALMHSTLLGEDAN